MATVSLTPTSHISADNDVVVSEIFIAAPRERIFQAITDLCRRSAGGEPKTAMR